MSCPSPRPHRTKTAPLRQAGCSALPDRPTRPPVSRADVHDDERLMMKRTLVTATAVALLLTGCATGDTGHLDPEISPDLAGPRSTQQPDEPTVAPESDGAVATPAPGTSAAPSNDVEAAFAASSAEASWYGDVTGVDVDDDTVLVTTLLVSGDASAVQACEAAFEAAEETGVLSPRVLVRDVEGQTISERDATAGDEGCSS